MILKTERQGYRGKGRETDRSQDKGAELVHYYELAIECQWEWHKKNHAIVFPL